MTTVDPPVDWYREVKQLKEQIDDLLDLKDRYENALNRIIYNQDVNNLFRAVEEAKRALGILEDD